MYIHTYTNVTTCKCVAARKGLVLALRASVKSCQDPQTDARFNQGAPGSCLVCCLQAVYVRGSRSKILSVSNRKVWIARRLRKH